MAFLGSRPAWARPAAVLLAAVLAVPGLAQDPPAVEPPPAAAPPSPAVESAPEPEHYHQTGHFPEETRDADGDGVPDIDDNCPNTPPDPSGKTRPDECGCPVPYVDPCSLDADGDGANDCVDTCPGTYQGHHVGEDGCPLPLNQPTRMRVDVKFAFDTATIEPGFETDLVQMRETLLRYPGISVTLEGHTDWTGTPQYNRALSEKRANACRNFILKDGGIAPERVKAIGYGEMRPIATNYSFEGRRANRRTVAEFTFDRTIVPANDQPPPLGDLVPE
jgi:outer membrane protein OmpA-like peptidoglycan-associated protein